MDAFFSDFEPKELHSFFPELEFFGVEDASLVRTLGQELTNSVEVGLDILIKKETVINTFFDTRSVSYDVTHPVGVGITSRDKSLGGSFVTVAAPGSEECSQWPVSFCYRHRVIAVPTIYHCFDLVWWNR